MSKKKKEWIAKYGSEKLSGKGCIYINNGIYAKRWDKNKEIPLGWQKGIGKRS